MPGLQRTGRGTSVPPNIAASRITRALASAVQLDDSALNHLREAVCDYVRLHKALESPPESIIATAKALMNDSHVPGLDYEVRRSLIARVIEWCISAYYGERRADLPIAVEPPSN